MKNRRLSSIALLFLMGVLLGIQTSFAQRAELISETGLLKEAEDAGYPMYVLKIEFPERKFSETFLLNAEGIEGLDVAELSNWVGKYVSFKYTSTLENALLDLKLNGRSILLNAQEQREVNQNTDLKTFKGVLSKAKAVTSSDLPDTITITGTNKKKLSFEYYITKPMVKANGKTVVASYVVRTRNEIVGIGLVK